MICRGFFMYSVERSLLQLFEILVFTLKPKKLLSTASIHGGKMYIIFY
jgi:hypothetical protein